MLGLVVASCFAQASLRFFVPYASLPALQPPPFGQLVDGPSEIASRKIPFLREETADARVPAYFASPGRFVVCALLVSASAVRVTVAGGTGFVGARVCKALVENLVERFDTEPLPDSSAK